jgi:hypothetical protein
MAASVGLEENAAHEGSHVNAMRHTLWQANISSAFGPDIATQVGNAHEDNPNVDLGVRNFPGKDALNRAGQTIDLLNNQIGRSIGTGNVMYTQLGLAAKVLDVYHTQGLYVAQTNKDGSVSVVRVKLSDEQYRTAMQKLSELDKNGRPKKKEEEKKD